MALRSSRALATWSGLCGSAPAAAVMVPSLRAFPTCATHTHTHAHTDTHTLGVGRAFMATQASPAASKAGIKATGATAASSTGKSGASSADASSFTFAPLMPTHQKVFTHTHTHTPAAGGEVPKWSRASVRTGVLALKCGMAGDYDSWGVRHALTVLKLEDVVVTGRITEADRGYTAVQIGAGSARAHTHAHPQACMFAKLGFPAPERVVEFRVTPDALLPVGTRLDVRHFMPGQRICVTGVSQGKGFQGVMKRHGYAGQGASHGNSINHRTPGSTGCRQDPGKVMKGKAMPGHMGATTVTVEGLKIYKIDIKRGLLYVLGSVPGKPGTWVKVKDAPKWPFPATQPPPFPTYELTAADTDLERRWAAGEASDVPHEWIVAPPTIDPFAIPENEEAEPA